MICSNRLDRIFTEHPVYGSRRLQVTLLREAFSVGRFDASSTVDAPTWAVTDQGNITGKPLRARYDGRGHGGQLGTPAYIGGAGAAIRAGAPVANHRDPPGVDRRRRRAGAARPPVRPAVRLIAGEQSDGTVFGGGSAQDKLELAAGIKGGSVAGIGIRFSGFWLLVVDDGATWLMAGANTLGANYLTLTGSAEPKVTGTLTAPGNFSIAGGGTLAAFDSGRIEVGSNGGRAAARSWSMPAIRFTPMPAWRPARW